MEKIIQLSGTFRAWGVSSLEDMEERRLTHPRDSR
jgi:hypothetical protein